MADLTAYADTFAPLTPVAPLTLPLSALPSVRDHAMRMREQADAARAAAVQSAAEQAGITAVWALSQLRAEAELGAADRDPKNAGNRIRALELIARHLGLIQPADVARRQAGTAVSVTYSVETWEGDGIRDGADAGRDDTAPSAG